MHRYAEGRRSDLVSVCAPPGRLLFCLAGYVLTRQWPSGLSELCSHQAVVHDGRVVAGEVALPLLPGQLIIRQLVGVLALLKEDKQLLSQLI